MATIAETLAKLDPASDDHWTADGFPRLEALTALGAEGVSRKAVNDAAPGFTRDLARAATPPSTAPEDDPDVDPEEGIGAGKEPSQEPAPEAEAAPALRHTLDHHEADVDEAEELVRKAEAELDEKRKALLAAQSKRDQAVRARNSEIGEPKFTDHLVSYHASQIRQREAKAERLRAFKESGLKEVLKTVAPSGLDAAYGRRPKRGEARPSLRVPGMAGQGS